MAHGRGWNYDRVQQVYYDDRRNYVIRRESMPKSEGGTVFVLYRMTGVNPAGVVFDDSKQLGAAKRLWETERIAASRP